MRTNNPDQTSDYKESPIMKRSRGVMQRIGETVRSFGRRKDGAAAVEFALVAPLLLTLYMGTQELSQGIEVNKKAGRASSLIADLVTQQPTFTRSELIAIADLAKAALAPYKRTEPTIDMVGIQITDEIVPRALVTWSQRVTNGSGSRFLTVGSPISIPPELMIRNTFIVKAKLSMAYVPFTAHTITNAGGLQMGETYHLRPRASPTVVCTDC